MPKNRCLKMTTEMPENQPLQYMSDSGTIVCDREVFKVNRGVHLIYWNLLFKQREEPECQNLIMKHGLRNCLSP